MCHLSLIVITSIFMVEIVIIGLSVGKLDRLLYIEFQRKR